MIIVLPCKGFLEVWSQELYCTVLESHVVINSPTRWCCNTRLVSFRMLLQPGKTRLQEKRWWVSQVMRTCTHYSLEFCWKKVYIYIIVLHYH